MAKKAIKRKKAKKLAKKKTAAKKPTLSERVATLEAALSGVWRNVQVESFTDETINVFFKQTGIGKNIGSIEEELRELREDLQSSKEDIRRTLDRWTVEKTTPVLSEIRAVRDRLRPYQDAMIKLEKSFDEISESARNLLLIEDTADACNRSLENVAKRVGGKVKDLKSERDEARRLLEETRKFLEGKR